MKRLVWMGLLLGAGVMLLWLRPGGGRVPVRSGARVANEGSAEAVSEALAPTARIEELYVELLEEAPMRAVEAPRREPGPDRRARILGFVRLGEGVVLGPEESFEGDQVEWRPEPTLVPRSDAQGEELAPLERWSSGGEVELRADGTFVLEDLPLGKELTLELVSFLGESELVCAPLRPGEQRSVELVLTRGTIVREDGSESPGRVVSGVVLDEKDEPVAFAEVQLRYWSPGLGEEIFEEVDEEGRFRFDSLLPDRCRITVLPEDNESERDCARGVALDVELESNDVHGIILRVQRGVDFEGTVTWPDGTPVRDFTCRFGSQWGQGELGKFRFAHVVPEEDEFWVHAAEDDREGWLTVRTSPRDERRHYVLEASDLRTRVELTVTVADLSGKGLAAGLDWQSVTDPSSGGNFTCSAGPRAPAPETFLVPLGEVRLTVTRSGYEQIERTLTILGPTSTHFVLQPAALVRGLVLDGRGEPVEGAEVFCSNWSADTDAQGRFELRPVNTKEGLVAWMDGHAYSEPVRVAVGSGDVVEGIVLRLRARCVLEGTFSELLRESHDLRLEAGGHVQEVETRSGFFVFDDLPPGPGSVAVLHEDGSTGPRVEFTLTPTKVVRVEVPVR